MVDSGRTGTGGRTRGLPGALCAPVEAGLERAGGEAGMSVSSLTRAGVEILGDSARRAGERDRQVAFELLAADGLLTLACEEAAGEPDVEDALGRVLRVLGEGVA